jgi:lipopolysaccharide transport system permease protein
VFYPIAAMPPPFRQIIELNPLALVIENARLSMMWGAPPNLG